jgi:hypothetical protein
LTAAPLLRGLPPPPPGCKTPDSSMSDRWVFGALLPNAAISKRTACSRCMGIGGRAAHQLMMASMSGAQGYACRLSSIHTSCGHFWVAVNFTDSNVLLYHLAPMQQSHRKTCTWTMTLAACSGRPMRKVMLIISICKKRKEAECFTHRTLHGLLERRSGIICSALGCHNATQVECNPHGCCTKAQAIAISTSPVIRLRTYSASHDTRPAAGGAPLPDWPAAAP